MFQAIKEQKKNALSQQKMAVLLQILLMNVLNLKKCLELIFDQAVGHVWLFLFSFLFFPGTKQNWVF